jgi:hypothetical protein
MNKTFYINFGAIFFLLICCQEGQKEMNDMNQIHTAQSFESTDSLQSSNHVEIDSLNNISLPDSIFLKKKKDSVYYMNRNILIYKSYIQPLKQVGGSKENPQEISDEVFLLGNCMILLKNIRSAGHFCHIPSIDEVKIINAQGDIYSHYSSTKNALIGFNFTSCFQGGRFNAPDNSWGVITIEAEGELYGFLLIQETGQVKTILYQPLEGDISYSEIKQPFFKKSESFILPGIQANKNLTLTKEGKIIR